MREIDGGSETIRVNLPAVITADLRLNQPRFANLPSIQVRCFYRIKLINFSFPFQKAKKKPMAKMSPSDLGVDIKPHQEYLSYEEPPKRQGGGRVSSVDELISKLKEKGLI
jgi:electron transfer flavoprotein beta subunit